MVKILLTLFTLLCFTGCTTLPLYEEQPALAQKSEQTGSTGGPSSVWVVVGILAAIGVVILLTRDGDGGGGGGGGY